MGSSLIDQMRKLRDLFWSKDDPIGRGFVPLAEVLRRLREFDEAERVLREGLERHPDLASGHVVAGRVHLDKEDRPAARAAFERALTLDSRNVEALRNLGRLLKEEGDISGSLGLARRLLEEEPWNQSLTDEVSALEATPSEKEGSPLPEPSGGRDDGPWGWLTEAEIHEGLDWDSATLQPDGSAPPQGAVETADEGDSSGDDQEWVLEGVPEPIMEPREDGALVTRTLGEIYLRQGLLEKAREVFSELVDQEPTDLGLQARLGEIESRIDAGGGGPVVPIQDLAPEASVSIASLAPETFVDPEFPAEDPMVTTALGGPAPLDLSGPENIIPIELLAPDSPLVQESDPSHPFGLAGASRPVHVVPIEALAPDDLSSPGQRGHGPAGPDGILDDFKDWLDNLP